MLVYNDEVGAAAPGLYGTLSSRAYWGKRAAGQVEDVGPQKAPFGDPLLHVDAGDFAQLRPVPRGSPSLMEAFLMDRDEYKKEQRVRPLTDMERLGLKTFDLVAANCVEFQGTYRFKPQRSFVETVANHANGGRCKSSRIFEETGVESSTVGERRSKN